MAGAVRVSSGVGGVLFLVPGDGYKGMRFATI